MINLEEHIKNIIEDIDITEMVRQEVKTAVSTDIKRNISKWTADKIDSIIETEIEIIMKNNVETDNGWGTKKTYLSFEDLFKQTFHKQFTNDYQLQNIVEKHIETKVAKFFKEEATKIQEVLIKLLIDSKTK